MKSNRDQYSYRIQKRINLCLKTLVSKNEEYGKEKLPLHNFYEGGKLLNESPEKALTSYLTKHLVSYFDMIENPENYSQSKWDEKLGDIINYFLLADVLIWEKLESDQIVDSSENKNAEIKEEGVGA